MIPTLSSCAWDDIVDARRGEDQVQRMQLYVNEDRDVTKQIVQQAEKRGCKGLFITVDNPQVGRREKDLRARQRAASRDGEAWHPEVYQGTSTFLDSTLCWDDVPLFPEHHQRAHRAQGHPERRGRPPDRGARRRRRRALEPRRAAARVRAAVARGPRRDDAGAARARGLQDGIDVFVDGGVRRGTDILKALCLGARGVGIGRACCTPWARMASLASRAPFSCSGRSWKRECVS
ncbi:cytochrome b2 [Verticillium alfalfae VaMs.102]|uniref:Cytochrome b2 n=1 Tax=Verticillium alfalfae (strain VaMs.102 / ATCC MYA-4576 / FGSC 10136) TaxID=526221 RepID=C9SXA5_VERA1|nr:cytochrome b2 [Verticillium alfalfae VaMs.102]EEY23295.1 cytochrome b2 [Verticillium alfalfae VaMs.102]